MSSRDRELHTSPENANNHRDRNVALGRARAGRYIVGDQFGVGAMIQIQQIDVVDRAAAVKHRGGLKPATTHPHLPQGIRWRMVGRGFATDGLQPV